MELTHTRLLVNNYRECFSFYRNVLGFEVTWGNEDSLYAEFKFRGCTLGLFERKQMLEAIGAERAKDMFHTNLENVLKLDEICKELNLSKFKFIRSFNAHTGISPYQYFLNCKIERAKQLLEKKRDIYSAVAECGFVDLTHLNKHFKSVYGTTAFEYMSHLN
ncbi:helix-turn-helix domain-containing protein [Peribacillus butanolivorans]|uniref:helix-turn-helix domain-containing protein n=1 Tax=Peribacillus butanolivorans TaxID=421767 RepID=UPI0030EEE1D1